MLVREQKHRLADRNFLKEDASDPAILERWTRPNDVDRYIATKEGAVVGYLGIHPLGGWSSWLCQPEVAPG